MIAEIFWVNQQGAFENQRLLRANSFTFVQFELRSLINPLNYKIVCLVGRLFSKTTVIKKKS